MKTKLPSAGLAFDENQEVRMLHLQPLISPARSDSCVIVEEEKVCGAGVERNEMVISIDYLCAYDPVLSPCIPKSTQIIEFSNFMLREREPATQNCLHDEPSSHGGGAVMVVVGGGGAVSRNPSEERPVSFPASSRVCEPALTIQGLSRG